MAPSCASNIGHGASGISVYLAGFQSCFGLSFLCYAPIPLLECECLLYHSILKVCKLVFDFAGAAVRRMPQTHIFWTLKTELGPRLGRNLKLDLVHF